MPGPFKMGFGFARMHERMSARTERKVQLELTREQAAMLEREPVPVPRLVAKSVIVLCLRTSPQSY